MKSCTCLLCGFKCTIEIKCVGKPLFMDGSIVACVRRYGFQGMFLFVPPWAAWNRYYLEYTGRNSMRFITKIDHKYKWSVGTTNCFWSWKPKPSSMHHIQWRQDGTKKLHIEYAIFCKWQHDLNQILDTFHVSISWTKVLDIGWHAIFEYQLFYCFTCSNLISFYYDYFQPK